MLDYCPIIGIPCRLDSSGLYPGRPIDAQNIAYSRAILQSGGIPVLIPVAVVGDNLTTLFNRVDGLLFSGGGDIDPAFYNQSPQVDNLSDIQTERDRHEIELVRMAIEQKKPFFAICRGIQVMNVAAGGNLWQDINLQHRGTMRHDFYYQDDQLPRNYIAHDIQIDPASLLYKILQKEQLPVNSLHHQAIKDVASSLNVTGHAEDGVIEVAEVVGHPFGLGVQWHPEELFAEHKEARKMFAAFIEAAAVKPQQWVKPNVGSRMPVAVGRQ